MRAFRCRALSLQKRSTVDVCCLCQPAFVQTLYKHIVVSVSEFLRCSELSVLPTDHNSIDHHQSIVLPWHTFLMSGRNTAIGRCLHVVWRRLAFQFERTQGTYDAVPFSAFNGLSRIVFRPVGGVISACSRSHRVAASQKQHNRVENAPLLLLPFPHCIQCRLSCFVPSSCCH